MPRCKKLAAMLAITIILLSFTLANLRIAFSSDDGGKIDVFTQKQPYSGAGLNMPSDAFGPEEVVILYANVTYNQAPLENMVAAFDVLIPSGKSFSLTAKTNSSGIATVNFTISTPPIGVNESEVFGLWTVVGSVLIGGSSFYDSLTFKVDYIMKLISARAIDQNLTTQSVFGMGGDVGLEITLRSIAMSLKNATIAVTVLDETHVLVNSTIIRDFAVQPNEKLVFLYASLFIPSKGVRIGNATIFVAALTKLVNESGVPYGPGISTGIYINSTHPLTILFHDAAVIDVASSATRVELGQPLDASVVVNNEATEAESFNVSAYLGDVRVGTLEVTSLQPYSHASLTFAINTSEFSAGNYTLSVSIPPLPDEADLTDNLFVDGIVTLFSKQPTIIHDVAVSDVRLSSTSAYVGESVQINVTVVNKGNGTETFSVETYGNSSLIGTLNVSALAPSSQTFLVFAWNTSGVSLGIYQISASAPLAGDVNASDNTFVDGFVEVKAVVVHDVAVLDVVPESSTVYSGDFLGVSVTVRNKGGASESFNVTLFYDSLTISTLWVNDLAPGASRTLAFSWDTQGVLAGNYTLTAFAAPVAGETNTGDNYFTDGVVEVRSKIQPQAIHDVAVLSVTPSLTSVYVGAIVQISVLVKNQGNLTESFNVTAFYDSNIIATLFVVNLAPDAERMLVFQWSTENVAVGNYTLSASAPLPSDVNASDNTLIDGVVEVNVLVRDVAVLSVVPAGSLVYIGDILSVNVTVKNKGTIAESFDVTLRYDSSVIDTLQVTDLAAGAEYVLTFSWNTNGVSAGNYTLNAFAGPVSGEVNISDNSLVDGVVKVVEAPAGGFGPDWFWWLLLLLLALLIILLIAWLWWRRRKKKQAAAAFRTGFTAWYYCYDLRNSLSRFRAN